MAEKITACISYNMDNHLSQLCSDRILKTSFSYTLCGLINDNKAIQIWIVDEEIKQEEYIKNVY